MSGTDADTSHNAHRANPDLPKRTRSTCCAHLAQHSHCSPPPQHRFFLSSCLCFSASSLGGGAHGAAQRSASPSRCNEAPTEPSGSCTLCSHTARSLGLRPRCVGPRKPQVQQGAPLDQHCLRWGRGAASDTPQQPLPRCSKLHSPGWIAHLRHIHLFATTHAAVLNTYSPSLQTQLLTFNYKPSVSATTKASRKLNYLSRKWISLLFCVAGSTCSQCVPTIPPPLLSPDIPALRSIHSAQRCGAHPQPALSLFLSADELCRPQTRSARMCFLHGLSPL